MKFTRRPEVLVFLAIVITIAGLFSILTEPVQAKVTQPVVTRQISYAMGDEIIELRTETSKAFWQGGQNFKRQFYLHPIHYKDNYKNTSEQWKNIDLTIINNKITKAPYELTIDPNSLTATVRDKKTNDITSVTLANIPPGQINKANVSIVDNQIKWTNILPDIDLAIIANNSDVRFTRTVKSASASKRATFAVSQTGNSVKVEPKARDASGKEIAVQSTLVNGLLTEDVIDTSIVYPIKIDPSLTVYSETYDFRITFANAVYNTAWTSATGTRTSENSTYFGQFLTGGVYYVYRYVCYFNTTAIPNTATISNAVLGLYITGDSSTTDFGMTVQNGMPLYPSVPPVDADFDKSKYSGNGGNCTTAGLTLNAYNNLTFNATGRTWVNVTGLSKFMIRNSRDIDGTAPTGAEYVVFTASTGGGANSPRLIVTYSTGGPTVATWKSTSVQNTTATIWGNVTASVGSNVTVRGFYYGSSSPPLTNVNNTGSWAAPFSYSKSISTLSRGTKYYFKAFATNAGGTNQGSELTFLTKPSVATAFTATAINQTRIDLSWVKGTGATNTYIVGKLGAQPANRTDGTLFVNSTALTYSHMGLVAGQHWYYSAWGYTINGTLEQYSDTYAMSDATTLAPPTVTTGICSGFTTSSGIVNAGVTSEGTTSITQYGFEYGLTIAYGTSSLTTGNKAAGSTYLANLTGLTPSATYHYRAKAYNGVWGYGADQTFTTKGSPALWEKFNTGDNATFQIYQQNWGAQVITTNTTAHTVTSVRLKLFRSGSPGTVTVSMRYASGGVPTGVDLTSGTIDGNTFTNTTTGSWYTIDMTEYSLVGSSTYAIVVRAPNGSAANYVGWREASGGGYTGGTAVTSTNSGVSWTAQAYDFMFEIWGNTCMEIQDVKVFSTYKTTDDWLFTVRYVNTFPPYYDTYDIKRYFSLQLLDTAGNVRAATTLPAWGNRVSSIYLSPALAGALEWGAAYRIRIYGTFSGNPYTEYFLVASDWQGSDLTFLDSWVITSAGVIMDYYSSSGLSLTTYVAGRGEVLNATGGSLFDAGISGLSKYRPSIFQTYSTQGEYNPTNWNQGYRNTLKAWQSNIGTDGTVMATRLGNMVGMDGGVMLALFFILAAIVLAGWGFQPGHGTAACIMAMIPIMGGVFFGIDLIFIGIIVLIAAFIFVKRFWIDTGA